jgi:large subunit ribosomal protein L10
VKKDEKDKTVRDLEAAFAANATFYLVDFKQMPVGQTIELRRLLRKNNFTYQVVKNRLALRALGGRCPAVLKPYFRKPTGIAWADQNPLGLAKLLRDFSAGGKVLAVKAGILEGQVLPPGRFDEVVKFGSREALLGRFGYLMAYPLTQFLRSLQAPLGNMGRLLSQLKQTKQL